MKKNNFFIKKLLGISILAFGMIFLNQMTVTASDLTSTNFIIKDPIIGTGGGYGSSTNFQLLSAGHTLLSGVGSSSSFITRYGFLYYEDQEPESITFDLDTATTDTESGTPYVVPLGTLSTGAVARSNGSINSIWVDLDSSDSTVITVLSSNLKSTSVPGDIIPSVTSTMAAGTANYGLCVASTSSTTGTLNEVSPYNGATCVDGAVNTVGVTDGTTRNILNSNSAAITGGRAQIRVNAAISTTIPAHNDYSDALTFIATSTF